MKPKYYVYAEDYYGNVELKIATYAKAVAVDLETTLLLDDQYAVVWIEVR